jgi:hypothetical protein
MKKQKQKKFRATVTMRFRVEPATPAGKVTAEGARQAIDLWVDRRRGSETVELQSSGYAARIILDGRARMKVEEDTSG